MHLPEGIWNYLRFATRFTALRATFFAAGRLAAAFLAAGRFFAAAFLAAGRFFATAFLAGAFLAAFFAAGRFLATAFLAGAFFFAAIATCPPRDSTLNQFGTSMSPT
jgi:hypothetical protein